MLLTQYTEEDILRKGQGNFTKSYLYLLIRSFVGKHKTKEKSTSKADFFKREASVHVFSLDPF